MITIPITEHDVELFKELVETGVGFEWEFDGVTIAFVPEEDEDGS